MSDPKMLALTCDSITCECLRMLSCYKYVHVFITNQLTANRAVKPTMSAKGRRVGWLATGRCGDSQVAVLSGKEVRGLLRGQRYGFRQRRSGRLPISGTRGAATLNSKAVGQLGN
jgi:hypothetical protein